MTIVAVGAAAGEVVVAAVRGMVAAALRVLAGAAAAGVMVAAAGGNVGRFKPFKNVSDFEKYNDQ